MGTYVGTMRRPLSKFILFALMAVVVMTLTRMSIAIPRGSHLTHEAGVWTGLAMDLRDGLFYRPVFSDAGYGGTRYSPLHMLLHSALMHAGLAPIPAGFMLVLAAIGGVLAGMYAIARAHGVDRSVGLTIVVLALATSCVNMNLLNIRSDFLAAALNLAGLVAITIALKDRPGATAWTLLAALGFALAIFTKVTSIAGMVAAVITMLVNRQSRHAILVGGATVTFTAIAYAFADWASDGRLLDNFRACATAGGGVAQMLEMPARLWYVMWARDPIASVIVLVAIVVAFYQGSSGWRELPTIALAVTTCCTIAIYLTPGTAENHLIDLVAIALVFLGISVARGRLDAHFTAGAVLVVCVASLGMHGWLIRLDREYRIDNIRGFADGLTLPFDAPIFSDSAIVPVIFGQRPFVLDDYMFPVVARQQPEMTTDLYARLDRSEFPIAVFRWDPLGPGRAAIYGKAFSVHLLNGYEFWERRAGHYIYRPKKGGGAEGG